jgi:hypothetical protein
LFTLDNIINHYVVVIDESWSMYHLKASVVKVVDNLTKHLAETSKDLNQETRLSVYAFNSAGTERCLVWDIDVLRMPSIAGMYEPDGRTALVDCTILAINDLKAVPTKYGDHSYVLYVITDGQENDSRQRYTFHQHVDSLQDNWTLAVFVPDQTGVTRAKTWGFPADNIKIWDTTSVKGLEDVGAVIRSTSTKLMQDRKKGIRGTKSLFKLQTVSTDQIKAKLDALPAFEYHLGVIPTDYRSDSYVNDFLGRPWVKGQVFYQLTKQEKVQHYKQIAILSDGRVYVGQAARTMLGLPPNEDVEVVPDNWGHYKIFVQSTAPNRKLLRGTQVLVMNKSFALTGQPWQQS